MPISTENERKNDLKRMIQRERERVNTLHRKNSDNIIEYGAANRAPVK